MMIPNLVPKIGQSLQHRQIRYLPMTVVSKIVGKGPKTIDGPKIAITSIVRNEERYGNLGKFLNCCQELEQYHKNIVYIFIEGDSSDKTYGALKNWIENRDGSVLEKIDAGYPPFMKDKNRIRTTYFAKLRNILIDIAISMPDVNEVLMIDASYIWKGDLISPLRETGADIAAPLVVMPRDHIGKHVFYDIWAFRKNGKEFGAFYPYAEGIESNNPIDIDSAGGCYLIKRRLLDAGIKYSGEDSEHVMFCNNARNAGFSIKINPNIYIRKSI